MTEPRCGLVNMQTGHLLAKLSRGDCAASMSEQPLEEASLRKFKNAAYEFKLQVAEADEEGNPRLLWIRIGAHPQRCLCVAPDGSIRLENWMSPGAAEPLWRVHYCEATQPGGEGGAGDGEALPATCLLQSVKTGRFLCARDGAPVLADEGDIWGLLPLRGAMTPGKVLRRSMVLGGGAVALASAGAVGAAGVAVVGAATRGVGAVTAAGTAVAGTVAATSAAAKAISGMTVAKVAACAVSVPSAVMGIVAAGTAAVAAVTAAGGTVHYAACGMGCGVAIAGGGVVAGALALLVGSARDPGLYVNSAPFVPAPIMRTVSKLSMQGADGGAAERRSESGAAFDD